MCKHVHQLKIIELVREEYDGTFRLTIFTEKQKPHISCKGKVVDLPDTAALWSPLAAVPTISTPSKPLTTLGTLTDLTLSLLTPS